MIANPFFSTVKVECNNMTSSHILVLNSGSSSLKFAIIDPKNETTAVSGLADRIGQPDAGLKIEFAGEEERTVACPNADHREALHLVLDQISAHTPAIPIDGIGHRVVHGGEFFRTSVTIDDDVIAKIKECSSLAPLHNPANLVGIEAMSEQLPDLPQVAVFDTAFHQSLPARAFTYALPYKLYKEHGLRRYGFHGTSHRYVTLKTAELLEKPANEVNLITAHLGNGCSASAILNGASVDTTMGLTPLEGLVMGTRCGDVDPGLIMHLQNTLKLTTEELNKLLNKESGLLGISGASNDMRTVMKAEAEGNQLAALAIEVFCFRLAKSIASLAVSAWPLDAIVFTGGIGENSNGIRERVCKQLSLFNIKLDEVANKTGRKQPKGLISTPESAVKVMVVPTNEELLIAQDTYALMGK